MSTLFINACIRPQSRTLKLAKELLSKLEKETGAPAEVLNLEKEHITPLTVEQLQKRDSALENGDFSDPYFRYAPEGYPQGLCKAKKFYYVTTSGGFIGDLDFGFQYAKALTTKLYGIPDVECIRKEGLDIVAAK